MENKLFGTASDGRAVDLIRLSAGSLRASVLTYGAILQSLEFDGAPMVLGYEDFALYEVNPNYTGTIVGRFANRLARGKTRLNDMDLCVDCNAAGGHHLHGGSDGTHVQHWDVVDQSSCHVTLGLTLPDGHMGFPGTLAIKATYRILEEGILEVDISAVTDSLTLCSFAHHSYFNLGGGADILDHHLSVDAESYLPTDEFGIPLGDIRDVDQTGFDLRSGPKLAKENPIDHNFCLAPNRRGLTHCAKLMGNGYRMDVSTTEPGLQVYTAHGMRGAEFSGVALEPQLWPDGPNQSGFPKATLDIGEPYHQVSQFKFSKA